MPMKNEISVTELPFHFRNISEKYGEIFRAEALGPGVYYIATHHIPNYCFSKEYLAVTADSPVLSPTAYTYGTPVPTDPIVYLYSLDDYFAKGRHVVCYELHKYLIEHNLPLPEEESLQEDIARGMEVCPEYFGEFPVPAETPWGPPIQVVRIDNGLFWLKTKQDGWVLAIGYPIGDGLNDGTQEMAELTKYDRENGIDTTCGYRFYPYQNSCLPIFELIPDYEDSWAQKINRAALHNALIKYFPSVVEECNQYARTKEERITWTPDADTNFYPFPE